MDKFTKTTEIDISAMNSMEEETPKSSKAGKVIAIILSLIIAIAIWLYVIETDPTKYDKTYNDIEVPIVNISDLNVQIENVSVVLSGTKRALADVKIEDIVIDAVDASAFTSEGTYKIKLTARVNDDISIEAHVENSGQVEVVVTKK